MKVVLTEKPSVARDIASFLGARSRRDGYFEGGGYQVCWAFGHLVELKEPDDYDPRLKRWSLDTLPIVPDRFELKLRGDKQARQQFDVIRQLFRGATEVICATDAGREGELIFRYILSMSQCGDKPIRRLWLSSLTSQAIRDAFGALRPLTDYDDLYAAARCRSEADWIVGLNATRNYTVRYGGHGMLWSVGRVQTPVLAMIVHRDDEIRTFRSELFWELLTRYREIEFRYVGDRFSNEQAAREMLATVQTHDFVVTKVALKTERSLPPMLYDLTELQREMNRRYGMSAADTLKVAQSLYESKLITYPRTDSRFLGSDMKSRIPEILRGLIKVKPREIEKLDLNRLSFSKRIINDKKVSDHHAIIPTGAAPNSLGAREQRVFDAIATRLIAAFYPPCLKDVTTVEGSSNNIAFRTRGVRVTSPGWTELYPRGESREAEPDLPQFSLGERGPHEPFIKQGETTPPKHFTENTLLSAMETAGRFVDDEQLREALKEKGLGTPATRASIIETLLKRNYITRSEKRLTATNLGRYLVAIIQDAHLKSPELTGDWEAKLKRIESGQFEPRKFMKEITDYLTHILQGSDIGVIDDSVWGTCPQCGREIIQGKRGYGCSGWRDGCSFVLWPVFQELPLDARQIRGLLQHGVIAEPCALADGTKVILAMVKSGQLLDIPVPADGQQDGKKPARKPSQRRTRQSSATKSARSKSAPQNDALGNCPVCGADVVEQKKSYGCSRWRQGCSFGIWKTIAGKRISARTARLLLHDGRTSALKGFKSKAGKSFSARLRLVDGKVQFDFDKS